MDINKLQTADVLDIIFEGRNKEYGAYDLRKTYNKRLTYALISMLLLCLLMVVISVIANSVGNEKKQLMGPEIVLENMKTEEKKPEPPPPPPPP
ncbi:MAG: energy transducer TonB, partial [Sediminibacterium sp.]